MEIEKPPISKFNERCKQVILFLEGRDYVTKNEIALELGWEYPKTDRQIRNLISSISQSHPIISCSDSNRGYKLAKDPSDGELVKHSWAEIDSRIEELTKRKRPLIKFLDKHKLPITLFD